ncbi:MAG: hypothetical protein ACTS6G_02795 [Candidatus Hodgkinia cicadicola]
MLNVNTFGGANKSERTKSRRCTLIIMLDEVTSGGISNKPRWTRRWSLKVNFDQS